MLLLVPLPNWYWLPLLDGARARLLLLAYAPKFIQKEAKECKRVKKSAWLCVVMCGGGVGAGAGVAGAGAGTLLYSTRLVLGSTHLPTLPPPPPVPYLY